MFAEKNWCAREYTRCCERHKPMKGMLFIYDNGLLYLSSAHITHPVQTDNEMKIYRRHYPWA